ncbi:MAG: hypothetical protein H0U53_09960 [Actinobacteria bacterium]|nr:hypothetical protein [Actinomycetota bacterium]
MRLFKRNPKLTQVTYCEGCGGVCDERCRAVNVREAATNSALRNGFGRL